MIQLFHIKIKSYLKGVEMSVISKRIIILACIVIVAFILGRLAVRAVLNLLLGGTLFGGNLL